MQKGSGAVLRAEELVLRRGGHDVVAGLGLEIMPGEAIMLLGRNGAGKSTLLRALAGLLRPTSGRVCWNGADIREDLAEHGQRLRWVGHLDAAKPSLTVRENLRFLARLLGGEVQQALDAMALNAIADQPARSLSSGQRRRLALSRLVLGQAPLWLLDEPTVGLDAASVARLGPVLARHRAAGGMIVAATHLPLPVTDMREVTL
ncbi:heme ABC exporter ATP-binding protein CcmA [Roseomonas elaeocarpi]|uniref:Heme ABC exporter ATP-binding protein CcmA n=1 Tax=Roseomonas elaeocarpi TaxID=907779 RepID=A0ABV6JTQ2_9PROT